MKTRYRVEIIGGWGNKKQVLILQIYKTWPDGDDDWHGVPTYLAGSGWRDATPGDLLENPAAFL